MQGKTYGGFGILSSRDHWRSFTPVWTIHTRSGRLAHSLDFTQGGRTPLHVRLDNPRGRWASHKGRIPLHARLDDSHTIWTSHTGQDNYTFVWTTHTLSRGLTQGQGTNTSLTRSLGQLHVRLNKTHCLGASHKGREPLYIRHTVAGPSHNGWDNYTFV